MTSGDDHHPALDETLLASNVERYCPSCDASVVGQHSKCPECGTRLVALAEPEDKLLGRELDGRFTVKVKLGQGGMGAVYRALQHSVGREVAVKVIDPRLTHDRTAAKRFLREAKLSSRLSQPNTVTVLDFGQTEDGQLYLVMELLQGRTLSQVLREGGPMTVDRAARIAVQVCDALEAAHHLNIVHRDLKPSNIMVLDDPPGRDLIKVLDFGLAKSLAGEDTHTTMTHSDVLIGTPSYMPPELAMGAPADHRADLYSLGVILYELVSGTLPFRAETINSMLTQHAYETPQPLPGAVPGAMREVIGRLLAKDPARRFQTAAELRDALTRVQRRPSGSSTAPPPVAAGSAPRGATLSMPSSELSAAATQTTARRAPVRTWALAGLALFATAVGGAFAIARWFTGDEPGAAVVVVEDAASGASVPGTVPGTGGSPAPAAAPAPAPAAAPDAAPAEPATVTIQLTSRPAGARARIDDQACTTPCELLVPRADESVRAVFELDGYGTVRKSLTPSRDRGVEAKLRKRRKPSPEDSGEDFIMPE